MHVPAQTRQSRFDPTSRAGTSGGRSEPITLYALVIIAHQHAHRRGCDAAAGRCGRLLRVCTRISDAPRTQSSPI